VRSRTQVGIVGAGPAGLMLSHLLHLRGIDSVVVDVRTRDDVERTVKAGVLEQTTVDLMVATGVGDRLLAEGTVHRGINLVFNGRLHRIDLHELTGGRSITLYAQHEVLKDLIARRLADGADLRFGVTDVAVDAIDTDRPVIRFLDAAGSHEVECEFVAGCDGAHSSTRGLIPAEARTMFFRQYPFAWFGVLAETSRPTDEVLYAHSERGFALLSSRSSTLQRMYFQCDPATDPARWDDEQIWYELRARVAGADVKIEDGPIVKKDVLPFRSLVCEPMQYGRMFLAGDAAHTVPPTGAKGMNLAIADVYLLDQAFGAYYATGDAAMLAAYSEVALRRVWRVQHVSWWWTSMLHRFSDVPDFDLRRQLAELEMMVSTRSARQTLAEFYVGPPLDDPLSVRS
jgi:p-hydroxybenzoate 3-monooxygenase